VSRFWLVLLALPVVAIEPSEGDQLLCVKRVYVDMLDGDDAALQMRNMLISALQQTHLFIVTENQERADAVLHGSATDLIFNETHSSSDGVNAHVQASTGSSAYKGGSFNKSLGGSLGETESSHSQERKHEASAAIRLVNKDGDVIWSTTQESQGSKFKGSLADVAEKVTRKLADDFSRARAARTPIRPPAVPSAK
jgi:curli biogenesis system outer membrane secretion channel CsgG